MLALRENNDAEKIFIANAYLFSINLYRFFQVNSFSITPIRLAQIFTFFYS